MTDLDHEGEGGGGVSEDKKNIDTYVSSLTGCIIFTAIKTHWAC